MTPRPEVEHAYWRFAAERQAIFHRRVGGDPAPWTDNSILRQYKFCNAYRASDRVSQFLIRHVIYDGIKRSAEDELLRIVLFRLFSRIQTWEALDGAVGGIDAKRFDPDRYGSVLDGVRTIGPIYTAAFILCATNAFGQLSKHRNHMLLLVEMMRTGLPRRVACARSLRAVFEALLEYPLIGPFMAYQIATDINYSELTDFSENDFTVAGPGALRGIGKVFTDTGGRKPDTVIMEMVKQQEAAFESRGIDFQDLFGRPLQAIDCQNLFCEVDKYSRLAFPELKTNRVRIKVKFQQTGPIPQPFYPPKWGINDRVGEAARNVQLGGWGFDASRPVPSLRPASADVT